MSPVPGKGGALCILFLGLLKPEDPQKLSKMLLGQGMILHGLELRVLSASRPGECFAIPTIPAALHCPF